MTAETDLPPMPMEAFTPAAEPAERRAAIRAYARACVSSATEALQRSLHEAVVHGNRQSGRAERLAEALRELFDDYKRLADSGDAGFWRLEETESGKKALAALEQEGEGCAS
jgi:hypothetical protein